MKKSRKNNVESTDPIPIPCKPSSKLNTNLAIAAVGCLLLSGVFSLPRVTGNIVGMSGFASFKTEPIGVITLAIATLFFTILVLRKNL
ncbi:hypothetical protein GOV14_02705 [Candidatus Pacearchaeota archaeon]|nr:hypothetical protein [Candidatus Pacearchaeota archaeon]